MIYQYQTGDAKLILPQAAQKDEAADYADAFEEIEAYSLKDETNAEVLAVFGFLLTDDEEAACFAIVSRNIGIRLREMIVFLRQMIPHKMAELRLKSAVMTVRQGFVAGARLARLLGFRAVAQIPDFYLGYDYQLFERRA